MSAGRGVHKENGHGVDAKELFDKILQERNALAEKYPLQLIGWHTMRRAHSIHDNNSSLEKIEPRRVWINPADARKRGIDEGNEVLIRNDRGKVRVKAHITDKIMEGVVALSQGAWYKPNENGEEEGGCINAPHPMPVEIPSIQILGKS